MTMTFHCAVCSGMFHGLLLHLPCWAQVTETMPDLFYWLPYPKRIEFKMCCLEYKCLHGLAPTYFTRSPVPPLGNDCAMPIVNWSTRLLVCWASHLEPSPDASQECTTICVNFQKIVRLFYLCK